MTISGVGAGSAFQPDLVNQAMIDAVDGTIGAAKKILGFGAKTEATAAQAQAQTANRALGQLIDTVA
ncbi:MAG: hypothetical protein HY343_00735 [Lentisphaerae bacterium]|nr:hypothetical protein [Lentisphaerota bacterium]